YENETWNSDELGLMQQGNTLGKMIEANTGITNLQTDVFKFTASISGAVSSTSGQGGRGGSSSQGLAGITVELEDTSGDVLATTVTNPQGQYSFNQLNGLGATGGYTVQLVLPQGFRQTPTSPSPAQISRG